MVPCSPLSLLVGEHFFVLQATTVFFTLQQMLGTANCPRPSLFEIPTRETINNTQREGTKLPPILIPWARPDYIRYSKTIESVSVILWKLIQKQFESVSVISGV